MWWDEEEGIQCRLEEDKARSRLQLNLENLWRTMLALEEGEEVLCILQIMFCCWLLEEEEVHRVGIVVWMVRRDQVAPIVWGKNRHKFEKEAQVGSQANTTVRVVITWRSGSGLVWSGLYPARLLSWGKRWITCPSLDRSSSRRHE